MRRSLPKLLSLSVILSGCTLSPHFVPVQGPPTGRYTCAPLPEQTASFPTAQGVAQQFAYGEDFPADWWKLFHSPKLDCLIRQALLASPTISASMAVLRSSQMNAKIQYEAYQLKAAQLALIVNLSTSAFKEAALRAQLETTQAMVNVLSKQLAVMEKQCQIGGIPYVAVSAQRTQVEQTTALIPPLELQLSQVRDQMAVYAGKLPSNACLPCFTLDDFTLPQELPISCPPALVRKRPDILAAEVKLHEATVAIGMAISRAQKCAAQSAYDQATANYYQALLQGFQNVADSLNALESDARALQACAFASNQAKITWEITQGQYNLGGVNYLSLLDAERQYLDTYLNLIQARASRLIDTAALFQALGGGWWNQCCN